MISKSILLRILNYKSYINQCPKMINQKIEDGVDHMKQCATTKQNSPSECVCHGWWSDAVSRRYFGICSVAYLVLLIVEIFEENNSIKGFINALRHIFGVLALASLVGIISIGFALGSHLVDHTYSGRTSRWSLKFNCSRRIFVEICGFLFFFFFQ